MKIEILACLLLLFVFINKINYVKSDCIWYGECNLSHQGDPGSRYNCEYSGAPVKQTNETYLKLLKELCPHLYNGDQTHTCCDEVQLGHLENDLSFPKQLMTRCPACFINFKAFLCDFTCSPKQREFLVVTTASDVEPEAASDHEEGEHDGHDEAEEEEEANNDHSEFLEEERSPRKRRDLAEIPEEIELPIQNKTQVVRLSYYVTSTLANNLFSSCKDVQYPASNQKVMDLICGTSPCTPKKLIDYMGNNPKSPFFFDMFIQDTPIDVNDTHNNLIHVIPTNTQMYFCDKGVNMTYFRGAACGCADCEASCPAPIPPPIKKECKLWGIDCVTVIVTILFVLFSMSFLTGLFAKRMRSGGIYESEDNLIQEEIMQKMLNNNQNTPISNNDNNLPKGSDTKSELNKSPLSSTNKNYNYANGNVDDETESTQNNKQINGSNGTSFDPYKVSFIQRMGAKAERTLNRIFQRIGYFCACHPILVLVVGVLFCLVLSGGFYFFSVITDPVELWSPETSETRINKLYYDTHFRPFYRTTQLIVRPTNNTPFLHQTFFMNQPKQYSGTLRLEFLKQVLELQNTISAIKGTFIDSVTNNETVVSLKDICFAPLKPDNNNCTIQSILNYYQNDMKNLELVVNDDFGELVADHLTHFDSCVASPTTLNDSSAISQNTGLSCLGDFGGTVMPFVGLGGYPQPNPNNPQYGNASALVITYIINNYKDPKLNERAMAWEKSVIDYLLNYTNPNMTISFTTERSIQDELDRESKSDIKTIVISYMAMFLYITLTLGNYRVNKLKNTATLTARRTTCCYRLFSMFETIMIDMKFTLGIAGVIIVIFSVVASIGLFSYFHIKATLIIFEVIPFLVLAVGVDNIFILVQNYQRDTRLEGETLESQIGRIVGRVGPSMLLTSTSESLAFILGALTPMPAVKIFSLYAALAVFIDFLLQITCFVSLMYLDCRRELSKRYNLFCCIKSTTQNDYEFANTNHSMPSPLSENSYHSERSKVLTPTSTQQNVMATTQIDDTIENETINPNTTTEPIIDSKTVSRVNEDNIDENNSGLLYRLFKDYYAPFILDFRIRPLIIIIFMGLFFGSVGLLKNVERGLDQKLSMPKDSYVLDYFEALEDYLSVGVPVYFVVKQGQDYSTINNQNVICSTAGCNIDSLLNQINQASLQPNYSMIAIPANSWLDDYFDWLGSEDCCRVFANDTSKFCPSSVVEDNVCTGCPVNFEPGTNRPTQKDFYKYFKSYMLDNPGLKCAKGGHAAYGEAVEILNKPDGSFEIGATFFMAYHKVGLSSMDFIESLNQAQIIAKNITKTMRENAKTYTNDTNLIEQIEVFPYSVSYVFYEQYLTIWKDGSINLCISLAAIFVVTGVLLGFDFYTSAIVCVTIIMIIINMFGAMYLLNIEFNAVSLVNLVMAVGISVEFTAHIAREFAISIKGSRINRAKYAITHMGSSVFSGITLTKILGIIVLAFSHSQLFQVFYFRMYLAVCIIGASHGLIFLPVLLSYIGPSMNKLRYYQYFYKNKNINTVNTIA